MRAIHDLAKKGDTAKIASLPDSALFDESSCYYIDSTDSKQHHTPLFFAAYYGHIETVRLLLEKGADVTIASEQGLTVLHTVISKLTDKENLYDEESEKLFSIAELLLRKNPDLIVSKDIKGNTPIDYADTLKPEVSKRIQKIVRGLHIAKKSDAPPNFFSKLFSMFWRNAPSPSYTRLETHQTPPPK